MAMGNGWIYDSVGGNEWEMNNLSSNKCACVGGRDVLKKNENGLRGDDVGHRPPGSVNSVHPPWTFVSLPIFRSKKKHIFHILYPRNIVSLIYTSYSHPHTHHIAPQDATRRTTLLSPPATSSRLVSSCLISSRPLLLLLSPPRMHRHYRWARGHILPFHNIVSHGGWSLTPTAIATTTTATATATSPGASFTTTSTSSTTTSSATHRHPPYPHCYLELREYTLSPSGQARYLSLCADTAEVRRTYNPSFLAFFTTEAGSCLHKVSHLYAFESLEERRRMRAELGRQETWKHFLHESRTYVQHQENTIFLEVGTILRGGAHVHVDVVDHKVVVVVMVMVMVTVLLVRNPSCPGLLASLPSHGDPPWLIPMIFAPPSGAHSFFPNPNPNPNSNPWSSRTWRSSPAGTFPAPPPLPLPLPLRLRLPLPLSLPCQRIPVSPRQRPAAPRMRMTPSTSSASRTRTRLAPPRSPDDKNTAVSG